MVRAPGGVVLQELAAEPVKHRRLEHVHGGGRRLEAHLGVGEVEDQVLPLVPDVVALEPEEHAQPVHEVQPVAPRHERRLPEVPDGA